MSSAVTSERSRQGHDPYGFAADILDPPDSVFTDLKFVPNCKLRQVVAEALGFITVLAALQAGADLPEPCGLCPQERFLNLFEEPNTDQLYGGAAGGSKSTSLLMGTLRASKRYPGLQSFWFRRSFPELQQSVVRMLTRFAFAKALGATWNASTHELRFTNGSILTLAHAKNVQEATALQSAEIQLLILDERTTIPPDVVDLLYTRVRSGIPGLPCLGIRSGTNPGNIGHSRVKLEYVEATDHGAREIIDKSKRLRRFIQARVEDTPQLGPEYAEALSGLGEALKKAYLEGDWDVFQGQVFSEWRFDRHVVRPFRLPSGWVRWGGIDWGHRAPSAVVWAAQDQDGRLWVYQELYQAQLGEKGLADRIKAMTGDEHTVFIFDPAMMNQVGDAMPVATILEQEGIPLEKGNNDRLSGWSRVHTFLEDGPACLHHRSMGWDKCPMLHVFENCADLIRTLPAVPYNTTGKLEDVDTDSEDHLPDALRYLVMHLGAMKGPTSTDLDVEHTKAPDGTPLSKVVSGRYGGDTSSGLDFEQEDNGKVTVSPFA